ncbi:MAG TPA: hypothetical protein VLA89_00765, partial [Gemmatimonadales bacterium]|nr:hypothetical protein [Gemmatimonadales bacterium]
MTPRLVFRPEAEAELLDARDWYEAERVGLGTAFAAAVETTVTAILQNPLAYPRVKGDTRPDPRGPGPLQRCLDRWHAERLPGEEGRL